MAPVQKIGDILADATFAEDLKKFEKQLIFDLNDIALITDEDDWRIIGCSHEARKKLQAAVGGGAGGAPAASASDSSAAASPAEADLTALVSKFITDPEELAKLNDQLIITLQDVAWCSEDDWKIINVSEETRRTLTGALSAGTGVFGKKPSELAGILKGAKFTTDLLILDNEMIYTLEDINRLTQKDWEELKGKRLLDEAKRVLIAALPKELPPHRGRITRKTQVGALISDKHFFGDRRKCEKEMIFLMADVIRMQDDDWEELAVSPAAHKKLLHYKHECLKAEAEEANERDEVDEEAEPTRGLKAPTQRGKKAIIHRRLAVLDRAIKAAHKLALDAEMESIRLADQLAKLRFKRERVAATLGEDSY